jgi:hypothetical protein
LVVDRLADDGEPFLEGAETAHRADAVGESIPKLLVDQIVDLAHVARFRRHASDDLDEAVGGDEDVVVVHDEVLLRKEKGQLLL